MAPTTQNRSFTLSAQVIAKKAAQPPPQTQALRPDADQIWDAIEFCSDLDASWGLPWPPYSRQVEGRI